MKEYFMDAKKTTIGKLKKQILEDAKEYDNIAIICLGPSLNAPSPFLTFASTIGTILKINHFPIYGDLENPIKIEKRKIAPIQTEIDLNHSNTFTLVIINSISDSKKLLGNIYYENMPFQKNDIFVGCSTLALFGSYGKNNEEYLKNSLSLEETREIAFSAAFLLMEILNEKQDLDKQKRQLKKETII